VLKPRSTESPCASGARNLLEPKKPQLHGTFDRFFIILDQGQRLQVKGLQRKGETFVLTCKNTKTHEQKTLTLPTKNVLGLLVRMVEEEKRTGQEQVLMVDMDKKKWGFIPVDDEVRKKLDNQLRVQLSNYIS